MTIPTQLTQGATTHIKDGLPVTTVSNLGMLTPAAEALIMSIKAGLETVASTLDVTLPTVAETAAQLNETTAIAHANTAASQKNAADIAALSASTAKSVEDLQTSISSLESSISAKIAENVVIAATVEMTSTGQVKLNVDKKNLDTGATSSSFTTIPVASAGSNGIMPKESYQAIDDLQSRVASLESGGIWRATFATYQALIESYPDLNVSSTDWTVNDYIEVESDSNYDGDPTRYVVVVNGQAKTLVFQKKMQAAVQIATESSTGVVLGSADTDENKYKVFVENDGSMNLIGADDIEANLSVAVPYDAVVGESVGQYKIVEKDGLLFRANSAILEVPAVFDPTAWTQVGGRDMALDEVTISKNADDKLQAIGVIEKNQGNAKYDWVGTYQEWVDQNVAEEHPEWICYITDDSTEDASDKLNTDVSNITTEGKETVVSWGIPDYTAVVKTSTLTELYADKNYYVKIQAATANGFDLYKGDTLIMTEIILSTGYVSSSCIVPKGYTIKFRDGDRNYNLWYCPLIA